MKNKLKIKNILIAVLVLLGVSFTTSAQNYGAATGHGYDTYVINTDRSNHRSEFRMQNKDKSFTFSNLSDRMALSYKSTYNGWGDKGTEIFAIGANGNVGIGITNPRSRLDVIVPNDKSANPGDNGIMVYNNGSSGSNDDAIIAARVNGGNSGNPFFSVDVKGVSGWSMGMDNSDGDKFKIANSWSRLTGSTRMTIDRSGNVGIGTTNPIAQLQLGNSITNRKLVLYQDGNNDHTFYGFGINNKTLRYQSDHNHVFYSRVDTNSSKEVFRINGNGKIHIGQSQLSSIAYGAVNLLTVSGGVKTENIRIGQSQLSSTTDAVNTMLTVTGGVKTDKVVLNIGSFPDYVFANDYPLMPIEEVAKYITNNKHLPNIPSEKEMVATGLDVTAMSVKLVEKIEELTLYTIAQQETITKQQELIKQQQIMINKLAERLEKLENK